MTVRIEKPAINVREELADLRKPSGVAGEAMLRADTPQEQFNLIGAGRRNVLINGAMQVAQRGTSFTSANGYTIDRFFLSFDVGAVTVTKNAVTDLAGFSNSFKVQCTTTATSTGTDHNFFQYLIEGQDCQQFGFGHSEAKELTLSFYAKSNNTDTRVIWLYNPSSARMYAQTFSNSAADTWERIIVSIPADTAGSIANNTNSGFYVRFVLAAGPDYKGGIPSSGWVGANNSRYQGVSDFLDSTSNYIEVTGVQLELGKVATPFEHRSYGEELAACQRYYEVGRHRSYGYGAHTGGGYCQRNTSIEFKVTKRAAPTSSQSGGSSIGVDNYTDMVRFTFYTPSSTNTFFSVNATWTADAEL